MEGILHGKQRMSQQHDFSQIVAIVFDFDGTLVDSLRVKYEARFDLFASETQQVQAIAAEVIPQIRGKLRGEIIRAILARTHSELSGSDVFEKKALAYIKQYDTLVEDRIITQGLFPGTREMLKRLSAHYVLYINSGTPEYALRNLLQRLHIEQYIHGAYGVDPTRTESAGILKQENLEKIIAEKNTSAQQVLVIGDSAEDLECANTHGCPFIGIFSERTAWNEHHAFPILASVAELPSLLKK